MTQLSTLLEAARCAAWQPHSNVMPERYEIRRLAFDDLRAAVRAMDIESLAPVCPDTMRFVVLAAQDLAGQTHCNVQGLRYYDRRASLARLRGALAIHDGVQP